jgi:hypothetical protein
MGQHVSYVDLAPIEVDRCDEPVLVPADVEHDEIADEVRAGKVCLSSSKLA